MRRAKLEGLRGGHVKADEGGVELESGQLLHLQAQALPVPAGQLRQAVVGQDIGPALGVGEVGHQHAGDLGHPLRPGGLHPAVAGNDVVVKVDEHRRHKAKLPQGATKQPDLLGAVGPGVAGVWHKLRDGHHQQLLRRRPHGHILRPGRWADPAFSNGPSGLF